MRLRRVGPAGAAAAGAPGPGAPGRSAPPRAAATRPQSGGEGDGGRRAEVSRAGGPGRCLGSRRHCVQSAPSVCHAPWGVLCHPQCTCPRQRRSAKPCPGSPICRGGIRTQAADSRGPRDPLSPRIPCVRLGASPAAAPCPAPSPQGPAHIIPLFKNPPSIPEVLGTLPVYVPGSSRCRGF